MRAIHLICGRTDTDGLRHVHLRAKGSDVCTSGFWYTNKTNAEALRDGWLYLHPRKVALSEFGGVILDYEVVPETEDAHASRIRFTIRSRREGKG